MRRREFSHQSHPVPAPRSGSWGTRPSRMCPTRQIDNERKSQIRDADVPIKRMDYRKAKLTKCLQYILNNIRLLSPFPPKQHLWTAPPREAQTKGFLLLTNVHPNDELSTPIIILLTFGSDLFASVGVQEAARASLVLHRTTGTTTLYHHHHRHRTHLVAHHPESPINSRARRVLETASTTHKTASPL